MARRRPAILLLTLLMIIVALLAVWAAVTQPVFPVARTPPALHADPALLRRHVEKLAWSFFPRDSAHAENLDRVAAYVRDALASNRAVVGLQTFEVSGRRFHNVIAGFGPDTRERIVVGAHYDAAGEQPGADDNASGVAGLIELGRLLKDTALPMRVELAAYTLEEAPWFRTGYMGSAQHVQMLQAADAEVRMMFSLEMIGYFDDTPGSQHYPMSLMKWWYPDRGNYIAVVGEFMKGADVRTIKRVMRSAGPLPVHSLNAPAFVPGVDWSDHLNFWRSGMPAVMITDTAFYRNEAYHTSLDTPDRLDYDRMAMVIEGVYAAVVALACGDRGPDCVP